MLRFGPLKNNVKVKQLIRRHNLVFIEYQPLSLYSEFPSLQRSIPVSSSGILLVQVTLRGGARSTRHPLPLREAEENRWHDRAGHLGQEAIRALAWRAKNVRIRGLPRIKCEACSVAVPVQDISHRPPHLRSFRPFWRILWDLFDYPTSFDGKNWLLVIKGRIQWQDLGLSSSR